MFNKYVVQKEFAYTDRTFEVGDVLELIDDNTYTIHNRPRVLIRKKGMDGHSANGEHACRKKECWVIPAWVFFENTTPEVKEESIYD